MMQFKKEINDESNLSKVFSVSPFCVALLSTRPQFLTEIQPD